MNMDEKTYISTLRKETARFAKERDWEKFHNPKDLSMALAVEASELMDLYLWDREPDREALEDELGDVLHFLLEMSNATGIDLSEAFWKKQRKNEAKYPADLVRGRADKYTTYKHNKGGR